MNGVANVFQGGAAAWPHQNVTDCSILTVGRHLDVEKTDWTDLDTKGELCICAP